MRLLRRQRRAGVPEGVASYDRIYRIQVDALAGGSPEEILAAYRSRPDVEYAEFNPIISICATPDDPSYGDQWSLAKIQAPQAWDTCRGDHEVVVAIIDTGVDYNHRDLQGNLWVNEAELKGVPGEDDDDNGYVDDIHGYNFAYNDNDPADDHGHGTHVAGIVAAAGDNGLDVAGVCWNARIMAIKILGADGDGNAADAVPAIYYAVANGADIISGSWGGQDSSDALKEAVAYAHQQGVIVVAAAGNENSNAPYYPAAYPEVLSVAATDSGDHRWYLSNYGDWVDLAAPGRDITSLSVTPSGRAITGPLTGRKSGTSMAVPHVSGACALLLSADPLLACDELQDILKTTGDPLASGICSSNSRLNVYEALRAAIPPAGTLQLDREHYGHGTRIGILLADWHLRDAGRQVVVVEAGGDEERVTLTETPISLGVFRGEILVRNANATRGDGILHASNGQSILARYLDDDDGLGHSGQWRAASAVADYEQPVVLYLRAEVHGLTATISLLANEPVRAEVRYNKTCSGFYNLAKRETLAGESHDIDLTGLSPQTTYCFVVAVTDEAGNETLADNAGQPYTFVTAGRLQGSRVPADHATIQSAIDAAIDGDTIWVADGAYSGDGNLEIDFQGKAITVRSENGPAGCIIDCRGEGRAFYFGGGETADSVLDGLTITNGSHSSGAGILCMGSSPTIRNCIFSGNAAEQYGGGLCNSNGSHPTVVDCTFRENSCSAFDLFGQGGAIANRYASSPILSNCTFIDNSAGYSAGAIGNFEASSPHVARCVFRNNSVSLYGGAVGNWQDCRPVFKECVFSGNRAEFEGRGIVNMVRGDGGAVANVNAVGSTFENCTFSGNIAGARGGAMNNDASGVAIVNCTISGNHSEQFCGGIWNGAAGEVHLDNSIFWGNTDGCSDQQIESAQIAAEGSEVWVRYCDVQGWSDALGGIGNFGLDPLFVDPNGGDYHLRSEGRRWDSQSKLWTRDSATSPCIDAGNPGYPLGNEPQTIPGDPNSSPAGNKRIDMGAFGGTNEASVAPFGRVLLADVNNDGAVNGADFARMAANWTETREKCETDLTRDGRIDGADLARLADEWRRMTLPK